MLVIRGVNIYPSEVERVRPRVRLGQPGLPAGPGRAGRHAAPGGAVRAAGPAASGAGQAELEVRLRNVLGVRIGVRLLPWGTVLRTEVGKAVRVVRWAGGDPPVPGLS